MMTEKIKYIAMAASLATGLLLSSCTKPGVPGQYADTTRYITFGIPAIDLDATVGDFAGQPATRAGLTTSLDKFNVWGFCVANSISGNPNPNSAVLDWNQKSSFFTQGADLDNLKHGEVTVNGDYTTYHDGILSTWNANKEALHSFIATAGNANYSMENAVATTGSAHGPRLTVTLNTTGGSLTDPLDYSQQPDLLVAARFDHKSTNGRVNLSFFHIMTGIRFKFHNHTSDKNLVIKRVTYAGTFYRQAVFDFTTDRPVMTVPTDQTYSGIFTLLDSDQGIAAGTADYMGGDTPVPLLLLPNPDGTLEDDREYTLGKDKEITIVYTIGDDGAEHTFTHSGFLLNYLPQPNTLHTAHFNFVGDEFVVMFQADDQVNWQNGSDNDINIH